MMILLQPILGLIFSVLNRWIWADFSFQFYHALEGYGQIAKMGFQ